MLSASRFSQGIIGAARIAAHQRTYRFTTYNREANLGMTASKT